MTKLIDTLPWNQKFTTNDKTGKEKVTSLKDILQNPLPFGREAAFAAQAACLNEVLEYLESKALQEELLNQKSTEPLIKL